MPSAEASIVTLLRGSTALAALVPDGRIYSHHLPQNPTLPAIAYSRISAIRESAMGEDTGDVDARFQVSCFADNYAGAYAVADAVRNVLQRNMSSTTVYDIYLENELDLPYESDPRHYHRMIDFRVWYKESV